MRTQWRFVRAGVVLALVLAMASAALFAGVPTARATHDTVRWFDLGIASTAPGFNRYAPFLLTDGSANLYLFYYTTRSSSGTTNINVTKYALGTGFLGLPSKLFDKQVNDVANVVDSFYPLSATMDHTGNIYVAWTRTPSMGTGRDVYVSKSADGGSTWLPAVRANSPSGSAEDDWPNIATSPDGTVYVAWTQVWNVGPTQLINVTVSRSTNGGNSFIDYTNASGQPAGAWAYWSALTVDGTGRLYLAYNGQGPATSLHVNVTWSDDGITWAPPRPLTPYTSIGVYPTVLADAEGQVHVAWIDYRGYLTTGNPGVWYSRSEDRGETWTPGVPINLGVGSVGTYPVLAAHGAEVMAAWWSWREGRWGLAYSISADGGLSWYPELFQEFGYPSYWAHVTADQNGTFYAGSADLSATDVPVRLALWNGPPSAPAITDIARGTGSLTVSWAAPPEKDVAGYRVWRSLDGATYEPIATVDAATTTYADTDLANGTYWYRVTAYDDFGTESHPSEPKSATVGPTVQELIDALNAQVVALQGEIAALQSQLTDVQDNLTALQAQLAAAQGQITALQSQLAALQSTVDSNQAATQAQLASLEDQLNDLNRTIAQLQSTLNQVRSEQATQALSFVNLALGIIIVLLVVLLLMQMRKPKNPVQVMAPAPPSQVSTPPPPGTGEDL